MPRYDFYCKCGHVEEVFRSVEHRDDAKKCHLCKDKMKRQEIYLVSRDWFRPHWNENLDVDPVRISSKKQYRKECEKRGLEARCLL